MIRTLWAGCDCCGWQASWLVYAKLPTRSAEGVVGLLPGPPAAEQLFGRAEPATEIVDLELALAQPVAQLLHLAKKPLDLEHQLRPVVLDPSADRRGGDWRGSNRNRRGDRRLDDDGYRLGVRAALHLVQPGDETLQIGWRDEPELHVQSDLLSIAAGDLPQYDRAKVERFASSSFEIHLQHRSHRYRASRAQECAIRRELLQLTRDRSGSRSDESGDSVGAEAMAARLCVRHESLIAAALTITPPSGAPSWERVRSGGRGGGTDLSHIDPALTVDARKRDLAGARLVLAERSRVRIG